MSPLDERFIIEFSNKTNFNWTVLNPEIEDIFRILWYKYEICIFCRNRKEQTIQFVNKETRVVKDFKYDCEECLMNQSQELKKNLLYLKLWIHIS